MEWRIYALPGGIFPQGLSFCVFCGVALEENFIKRCADTFADERGLVIPLEDSDLIKALEDYPNMEVDAIENILASKYEQIVFEK